MPIGSKPGMRVPARVLSSDTLVKGIDEGVVDQISNVACLPGIQRYALCMPDAHRGYGFPIGGVAAFDAEEGVISPGGIGFDINCGMRLIRTNLTADEVKSRLEALVNEFFRTIPSGVGSKGFVDLDKAEFRRLMTQGSAWCLDHDYATEADIEHTESHGHVSGADFKAVSDKATGRGIDQMGTLGSGNHYLEIEFLREGGLYDPETAKIYGIDHVGQVVLAVHCGSRGFGHQIATDYLKIFNDKAAGYGLKMADRELAAAPIKSPDGLSYYSAMACAANTAFANRQVITHRLRQAVQKVFGVDWRRLGLETIYDVAHNIARFETYTIAGKPRKLLVHRKGATRSFGPQNDDIPAVYHDIGQPVIVGGSMETGSALFAGTRKAEEEYFGSTLHGSGRVMSRTQALKNIRGDQLRDNMARQGIIVKTGHIRELAEEAGFAYKDIDNV
ncbi:MAG: RtcB family protein, partial [candidate division Zixibacteria bacterium]|nr:RtcB family protein [candidate division Zixibacteria bacterium]